jgi:hypothetical protein
MVASSRSDHALVEAYMLLACRLSIWPAGGVVAQSPIVRMRAHSLVPRLIADTQGLDERYFK